MFDPLFVNQEFVVHSNRYIYLTWQHQILVTPCHKLTPPLATLHLAILYKWLRISVQTKKLWV